VTSSLPPHLLRPRGSLPGDARRGGNRVTVGGPDQSVQSVQSEQPATVTRKPQRLRVSAGAPGSYDPELSAAERPRTIAELIAAAEPGTDPWPAGSWVPLGTSGRRVHWTGSEWKGGESPGYPDRSESEQTRAADQQEGNGEL